MTMIAYRQILDKKLNIFAYEMVFRHLNNEVDDFENNFLNQQIEINNNRAFISFTAQDILNGRQLKFPKERVILKIVRSIKITDTIISLLHDIKNQGYIIALDGFNFTEESKHLLEIATIVNFDIMEMGAIKVRETIGQLAPYEQIKILATNIETHRQYDYLLETGCDYFQGSFFNKPNLLKTKKISPNKVSTIQLLAKLNRSDVSLEEISGIVETDVSLSYKLLNYMNSAFFSTPIKIESIGQAVTYLGINELRRWLNILMLSSLSDKPMVTMQNALIRGKMCESLAKLTHQKPSNFFLIGLLSSIDSILDVSIEEALQQLPLEQNITDSIIKHDGVGGKVLSCVLNYENWNINDITFENIPASEISKAYVDSVNWANSVMQHV